MKTAKTPETAVHDDEGFQFEEKKTNEIIEETKEDHQMQSEETPRKYEVIPPHLLFKPDWIQIPVKAVIRAQK